MARRSQPVRVWFVTPAWQRAQTTGVCLEQRNELRNELRPHGIELDCVVVADDSNLELAERHGFDALERDNQFLGRRVNDGVCHALERGCDFAAVVDSDCWVHPELLLAHRWNTDEVASSNNLALVRADGRRITYLDVRHPFGLGPMFIPRPMLERLDGRPVDEELVRGLSTSIWHNLLDAHRAELVWRFVNVKRLQYVGLQSKVQITREEDVQKRWMVRDDYPVFELEPFQRLREAYPETVVKRAAALYGATRMNQHPHVFCSGPHRYG